MAFVTARKKVSFIYGMVFLGGILLFVGLHPLSSPWKYLSLSGVLLSASVVAAEAKSYKHLVRIFDLKKLSGHGYYYVVICLLLGLLWAISFRGYLDLTLLPVHVTLFAVTAVLTGAVEEIIFRGYIQLKLRKTGVGWSVIGASGLHTFYKCFVFMVLPPVYAIDYLYFALWTFTMGCLLGWLKHYGRSSWVPVSGHALFDLVVYGDKMINAWWIWM